MSSDDDNLHTIRYIEEKYFSMKLSGDIPRNPEFVHSLICLVIGINNIRIFYLKSLRNLLKFFNHQHRVEVDEDWLYSRRLMVENQQKIVSKANKEWKFLFTEISIFFRWPSNYIRHNGWSDLLIQFGWKVKSTVNSRTYNSSKD